MKRSVLMSFLVIGAVAAMITAATTALFSNTVVSEDNTFSTGTLLLSVDNECGLTPDDQARQVGGPTCTITESFSATGMYPGGPSEDHDFPIRNDGSISGSLTITVADEVRDINGDVTTACVVNRSTDATPHNGWVLTYATVSGEALNANTARASDWSIDVALSGDAIDACQGTTLDLDITFGLDQNTP